MTGKERHVDLEKALAWREGNERMLARVREIFLKNIPGQVQGLGDFLESGDAGEAERMAHTIKGAASMMGAAAMSLLAGRIEESVRAGDLAGARVQFRAMAAESLEVLKALSAAGGEP